MERAVSWARALPLPSAWRRTEGTNPDDVLYIHPASGTSTFEHPMEDALRELRTTAKAALHLGEFRGQAELRKYIEQQIEDWRYQIKMQSGSDAGAEISSVANLELKIGGLARILEDTGPLRSAFPATHMTYDDDANLDKFHDDPVFPFYVYTMCPRPAVLVVSFVVICATLLCWELYSPDGILADDLRKLMKMHGTATVPPAPRTAWSSYQNKRNQSFIIPQLRHGRLPNPFEKRSNPKSSNQSGIAAVQQKHNATGSGQSVLSTTVLADSAQASLHTLGQPGKQSPAVDSAAASLPSSEESGR